MREVTLEILRHGPPNNQLLSPLTRYLALCGNHQAVTLELPYEHSQFLVRLRGLRYQDSNPTREMQLLETGKELGRILANVPGLIRELGDCSNSSRLAKAGVDSGDVSEPLTHLRLILSANELALLPFELVQSPNGFPGAGQPLILQTDTPVCMTREVRRVREESVSFDREPKILFLAASPPQAAEVPMKAHLLALRKAVSPWLGPYDPEKEEEVKKEVGKHLTVLLSADVDSIERVCSTGEFTHVHILAHGVLYEKGASQGFGLALHDPKNPGRMDVVDGDRLTTLLRPRVRADQGLVCPQTVTIASCDSANPTGSVVGAAASVAHSLHEGGIPLVVAAQFPLSFAGSVIITQALYEGLLWGDDPRVLFDRLRRSLVARAPQTHDWASLVAYASFPADLERRLSQTRVRQAERSIGAALKYTATAIVKMSDKWWKTTYTSTGSGTSLPGFDRNKDDPDAALRQPLKKIHEAKKRLRDMVESEPEHPQRVWIWGRLASTEKQEAEIQIRVVQHFGTKDAELRFDIARANLHAAEQDYRRVSAIDPSQSWGLVQAFVLGRILRKPWDDEEWTLARLLAKRGTLSPKSRHRSWSYADLLELHLVRWLSNVPNPGPVGAPKGADREADRKKALEYTERFVEVTDKRHFDYFSTRRQIVRYDEFFQTLAQWRDMALVEEILQELPEPPPESA